MHKPTIVFLMGNSGSGKSTLESNLVDNYPDLFKKVVSHTTRPIDKDKRKEIEGVHYYFVDDEEYDKLDQTKELIQKTNYGKYRYGSVFNEYKTDKDFVLISIVPEKVKPLQSELKKRGIDDFFLILLDISKEKIYENLKKSGETKESIENRFKRGDLKEQFLSENLTANLIIKDNDLNEALHDKVLSKLKDYRNE